MLRDDALTIIRQTGVIAIMRAQAPDQLLAAAEAVHAGGVQAIEVTFTTPGALDVIRQAVAMFGAPGASGAAGSSGADMLFGAGTVLDPESARAAILAGAQFIVCPTFNPAIIALCKRYSVPVLPGAFTPTEILAAWEAGADMVKVFPASIGGPAYIKAVRAPLPHVSLVPVGGVDLSNTADFIRAGADAVGVGGELINQKLLDAANWSSLTERARRFMAEVARGRAK
jgi:2-dehydro-3-deoxyphosphogluconate aldolase / (4S)-4-hydroxy-2-oxoglutarate aldolase